MSQKGSIIYGMPKVISTQTMKLFIYCCILCIIKISASCPRDRSRVVRDVIQHKIKPAYKKMSIDMPRSCPFYTERDIYYYQEAHKTEESYGKWYCDFCGKAFYAEGYLDHHLHNKHPDKLYVGPDSVCLSDFCDIFRCDVITRHMESDFWDTALCIEDDMSDFVSKCDRTFHNCMTPGLNKEDEALLINKTKLQICSSLTCNRYWDTGYIDESQWQMLLKTFLTVFLISGMIIYYFLAYHHFYDEALFERERPGPFKPYLSKPVSRHRRRKKYINTDPA